MKNLLLRWYFAALVMCVAATAQSQTTAFNYIGHLRSGGLPANGTYDLQFQLFDDLTAGYQHGPTVTTLSLSVSNGLFNTVIDFGQVFDGSQRWLDIAVRTNGADSFTTLSPRQPILPVPYSQYSVTAGSVSGQIALSNLPSSIALLSTNQTFNGTVSATAFSGDGSRLSNLPPTVIITNSTAPILSIYAFGAKGGTNDDTVAFQLAANSGKPVYLGNDVFSIANIKLTNFSQFIGTSATINQLTNALGFMMVATGSCPGIILHGITFSGQLGGMAGVGDGGNGICSWSCYGEQYVSLGGQLNNRSGVLIPASTPGGLIRVEDCVFRDFSDRGLELNAGFGAFPQPTDLTTQLRNLKFVNCFVGLNCTNNAEYVSGVDLSGWHCAYGMYIAAGNENFTGGTWERNYCACRVDGNLGNGSQNPAHGSINDMTFNHNTAPIICNDFYQSFGFNGLHVDAGGPSFGPCIFITNCAGVSFTGGYYNVAKLNVDGGGKYYAGYNVFAPGSLKGYPIVTMTNGGYIDILPVTAATDQQGNILPAWQRKTNAANTYSSGTNTFRLMPNESARFSVISTNAFDSGTIFTVTNSGLFHVEIGVENTAVSSTPCGVQIYLHGNSASSSNQWNTIAPFDLTQAIGTQTSFSGNFILHPGPVSFSSYLTGTNTGALFNFSGSVIELQ